MEIIFKGKKTILISLMIIAGIALVYNYFNNSQILVKQDNISRAITDIREEYKKINADSDLIIIEKDLKGLSTEGGVILLYYDKSMNLKKASVTLYGEMGKRIREYYYKNKKFIFCFQQQFYYNKPIYIEEFKIDQIEENRYYFYNQNLIKWIDFKKTTRNINNEEAIKVANELISEANIVLNRVYD